MELLDFTPLILLVTVFVLAIGLRYSLVDRSRGLRIGSFVLRALGIVFLVLALCRPYVSQWNDAAHIVFLVDVSQSVKIDAAKAAIDDIRRAIDHLQPEDSWSLYAVARTSRQFVKPDNLTKLLDQWKTGASDDRFRRASCLAQAMLDARVAFPAGKSRRIVLFSDGQETDDDIGSALRRLRTEHTDVRFNRIDGLTDPEAAILSIRPSTPNAYQGEVVRMAVEVASNTRMNARLRIIHRGVAVLSRPVALDPEKPRAVNFDVAMATPGPSVWSAELVPDKDHFAINNSAACSVTVRGKPRILILHEKPIEMRSWARALRQQDFTVDVRGKLGLPDSIEQLLAFDAIVLADLPATAMSPRQMTLLKRYVTDFAGGLVMMGSENSFGLGGYYKTPVEEVLPLVSRFEKEKEKPSLAIVLVIDKSGSMDGMPIALARQAAKAVVELLGSRDQIGVVGFDSQPYIISEMCSAMDAVAVKDAIDSLAAGGGTFMYPAMVAGKEMLENASAKIRHMIILSDGQTQPADHESLVQAMADSRITVSTVAIGAADRQLLANIAEIGHGRYYETDDPANVPRIFTKETMQASRSAIKEDVFGTVQIGDHPILAGYTKTELPFTLGYVMTEAKPTAQLLLVTETGDPLLAVSRYGLGTGLSYTSDMTERWGSQWLAWDGCGKFWAQALRGVVRHNDTEGMRVTSTTSHDKWELRVERVDENGTPVNGIHWDASLLASDGTTEPVTISQVGLGKYVARVAISGRQRFTLGLHDRDHEKLKILHYHATYPTEYRLVRTIPKPLKKVAALAPGSVRDGLAPERHRQPIEHWASFAALACLLGGVLLRRV